MPEPVGVVIPEVASRTRWQRLLRGPVRRAVLRGQRRRFADRVPFTLPSDPATTIEQRSGVLRIVERVDNISGAEVCRLNRDLVIDICESIGVEYFAIPEPTARRFRFGIPESGWQPLVSALLSHGRQYPLYIGVEASAADGARRRWSELTYQRPVEAAARSQSQLEVFRLLTPGSGRELFGRPWACVLDRWADQAGALAAPNRNPQTTLIGATHQTRVVIPQAGRRVSTFEPLSRRNMLDVDFPIDAVYMWVDGADPSWLQRKNEALATRGEQPDVAATSEDRFRESGELRYSFRSVERYLPWIRRIYLVTDRQVPSWLNRAHPSVVLVDHQELFGGLGRLPTFNSHAIGGLLHHISGLSEHYLHFNDDFFIGHELSPGAFFLSNGMSKFFLSRTTLAFADRGSVPEHEDARRNVADLLNRDFGRNPTRTFFHTPIAQRRSTLFEIEERYPAEMAATWSSQFRSSTDFEINSWFHHYYGYLNGRALPGNIRYDYFDLAEEGSWRRMRRLLRTRDKDVFCINDSIEATPEQRSEAMDWLERYLPGRSSFELDPNDAQPSQSANDSPVSRS